MKHRVTIALCVACLLAFVHGAQAGAPVVVRDLKGANVNTLDTRGSKAVCLLFIARDCPVSNRYAPEFNQIVRTYAGKGIRFYVVYCEADGKPSDAAKHHKEFGLACPGVLDPTHKLVKAAGATVTPEAAVFDSRSRLVYRGRIDNLYEELGRPRFSATEHDLRNALDAVVSGKPVPLKTTRAIGCIIYSAADAKR